MSDIDGNCLEARLDEDVIEVRDSADPGGPVLRWSWQEWAALIEHLPRKS